MDHPVDKKKSGDPVNKMFNTSLDHSLNICVMCIILLLLKILNILNIYLFVYDNLISSCMKVCFDDSYNL